MIVAPVEPVASVISDIRSSTHCHWQELVTRPHLTARGLGGVVFCVTRREGKLILVSTGSVYRTGQAEYLVTCG